MKLALAIATPAIRSRVSGEPPPPSADTEILTRSGDTILTRDGSTVIARAS